MPNVKCLLLHGSNGPFDNNNCIQITFFGASTLKIVPTKYWYPPQRAHCVTTHRATIWTNAYRPKKLTRLASAILIPQTAYVIIRVGSTKPPIQWISEALSPGVKRPGRESDRSPSSVEFKNDAAIPPVPVVTQLSAGDSFTSNSWFCFSFWPPTVNSEALPWKVIGPQISPAACGHFCSVKWDSKL
jgi:hypothetical protein